MMSEAFKCDSCGEYSDGAPMVITLIPPTINEKIFKFDLCPFCSEEVANVISREKVFGDLD